jgi:hypothetical protein
MGPYSFTLIRRLREFRSCARAVAAVEFSLLVPMLLTLGVAGGEVFRFLSIQKRVAAASEAVALMMSQAPADITSEDHWFIANSIRLMVPEVDHDARERGVAWNTILRVGMSSLRFEAPVGCTVNCRFAPVVRWTVGDRACGVSQFRDGVGVVGVPTGFNGARGSLVVADVSYEYRPLVFNSYLSIVPPMRIYRSVFLPPRYLDFVGIRWTPGSNANRCPGYSAPLGTGVTAGAPGPVAASPPGLGGGGPPGLGGGGPPGLGGGGPPGLGGGGPPGLGGLPGFQAVLPGFDMGGGVGPAPSGPASPMFPTFPSGEGLMPPGSGNLGLSAGLIGFTGGPSGPAFPGFPGAGGGDVGAPPATPNAPPPPAAGGGRMPNDRFIN